MMYQDYKPHWLDKAEGRAAQALLRIPDPVKYVLSGKKPIRVDGSPLAPELQMLLRIRNILMPNSVASLTVAEARERAIRDAKVFAGDPVPVKLIKTFKIKTPETTLRARLYVPPIKSSDGLIVFYHGGGFVIGGLETHDQPCRILAEASGLSVLAFEYRKAPENPFPAAIEDALSAYSWALENAKRLGADAKKIIVAGDSAGGNLAAIVSLLRRKQDQSLPRAQLLIYPSIDRTKHYESQELFREGYFLSRKDMDWYQEKYIGTRTEILSDIRVSPICESNLSGLPKTLVVSAEFDPLRDEAHAFVEALEKSGVETHLRKSLGLVHGYINMTGISQTALKELEHIGRRSRFLLM